MIQFILTAVLAVPQQDGFRELFDGASLTGWWGCSAETHATHQRGDAALDDEWQAIDGALFSDGSRLRLATVEEFGDAEFELEFQVGEAAFGGLYLRGRSLFQVVDASTEHPLGLAFGALNDGGGLYPGYQGTGGLHFNPRWAPGFIPLTVADRPRGEWNRLRLLLVGARLSAWLNGTLIHDHVLLQNEKGPGSGFPARGPLELGCFRGPLHWRKVRVREVDGIEATRTLMRSQSDGARPLEWKGDTDAWTRTDEVFTAVEDSPGVIYTAAPLSDFAVRFSFRLPRDSHGGVALRHTASSRLCEIVLSGSSDTNDHGSTGSVLGLVDARSVPLRPSGQWNFQEIRVRGSRVQVDLNGFRVLDADLSRVHDPRQPLRDEGVIGLVSHGTPLEVKDLGVEPLDAGWPSLEPFMTSRFWEMVPAFCGAQAGAHLTAENLETIAEVFTMFTSIQGEAARETESLFDEDSPGPDPEAVIEAPSGQESAGLLSTIPVVMHALEPLWTNDEWNDADVALARAAALQLAGLTGVPELDFQPGKTEHDRRLLAHLAAWFRERTRELEWYATMFFTLDEGPWRALTTTDRGERDVTERLPLGYGAEVRLLATEPDEMQLIEVARGGSILHRAWITEVPGNHPLTFEKAGEAMEIGDYGWRIQARFGVPGDIERLTLFLDGGFKPLFYFASW